MVFRLRSSRRTLVFCWVLIQVALEVLFWLVSRQYSYWVALLLAVQLRLVGCVVTALAASAGALFWKAPGGPAWVVKYPQAASSA